jgi:hypothetical protein
MAIRLSALRVGSLLPPERFLVLISVMPIAVAERSKARTVFARSNTAIVGLNPTEEMCVFCVRFFCFYIV